MPDIFPADPTYNPPPTGITITDYVTNDSDDNCFPRSESESEVDTGLDVPSYFPPEGVSLPPERATTPHRRGRGPVKKYPHNKVCQRDEYNLLRRANLRAKASQST